MGAVLVGINPFLAFIQRFVPRVLDGFLIGLIFRALKKKNRYVACAVTGFCSALFNTIFFMTSLVWLFGNTEYMKGLIAGRSIIVFVCAFVGVNAVCEMVASTIVTGLVGTALFKARVIKQD